MYELFQILLFSAVQGAQQLIMTLVDSNGNEVKVNLRPDDTPDDFFGDFVAGSDEPTNTITFDFNTQKESTWNIETSQQALKVLNKVQEARLTWYKLEGIGKIILFSYFHLHFSYLSTIYIILYDSYSSFGKNNLNHTFGITPEDLFHRRIVLFNQ